MSEDFKKAITLPVAFIYGVLGFGVTIYGIIVFFKSIIVRVTIIFSILLVIAVGIIINLYLLIRNLENDNSKLRKNNSGLIEAKDNYLEKNNLLEINNDKLLEQKFLHLDKIELLKEKLMGVVLHIQSLDMNINDKKDITNYALGGTVNGKKQLEGNKDN